jgi:hypothetical protein
MEVFETGVIITRHITISMEKVGSKYDSIAG